MKVHVLHENPDWYPPFAAAFDAEGVPHEQWLLGDGLARPRRRAAARCLLVADERLVAHPRPPARQGPHAGGARLAGGARPPGRQRAPRARAGDEQGRPAHRAARGRHRGARARSPWSGATACWTTAGQAAGAVHRQAQPGRQGPRRARCSTAPTDLRRSPRLGPTTSRRSTGSRCSRSTCAPQQPRITRVEVVDGEHRLRDHRRHRARRLRAVPGRRVRDTAATAAGPRAEPVRAPRGLRRTRVVGAVPGLRPHGTGSRSPGSSSSRPPTVAW